MLNVLVLAIVPPPLNPVPVDMLTDVWSICSFATKPSKLSCCISLSTALNVPVLLL